MLRDKWMQDCISTLRGVFVGRYPSQIGLTDAGGTLASSHQVRLMYGTVMTRAINGERLPKQSKHLCESPGSLILLPPSSTPAPARLSRVPKPDLISLLSTPASTPYRAGLVEGQQTKYYAEPVNVLALRLGLPLWLVDLRHESTHSQVGQRSSAWICRVPPEVLIVACAGVGQLPSLSSLRTGSQRLLDWLYKEYWQRQVGGSGSQLSSLSYLLGSVWVLCWLKGLCLSPLATAGRGFVKVVGCGCAPSPGLQDGRTTRTGGLPASAGSSVNVRDTWVARATLVLVLRGPVPVTRPNASLTTGAAGREEASSRTSACDRLISEALDGIAASVNPTFVASFLVPALLEGLGTEGGGDEEPGVHSFLLPDERLLERSWSSFPSPPIFSQGQGQGAEQRAWLRHRQLYTPLLVRLERSYPGFAAALRTQLLLGHGSNKAGMGSTKLSYGLWVTYLGSRDWHSHFEYGRACAAYSLRCGPSSIRFNLRDKPPDCWTPNESAFMQEPAPREVLQAQSGAPVSSVRIRGCGSFDEKGAISVTTMSDHRGPSGSSIGSVSWEQEEAWVSCALGSPPPRG